VGVVATPHACGVEMKGTEAVCTSSVGSACSREAPRSTHVAHYTHVCGGLHAVLTA